MRATTTALIGAALVTAGLLTPAAAGAGHTTLIRRTEYGIPHIQADNYETLGYGEGYAFAQDNPCTLVQQAITLAGDRTRWFGPTAPAPPLGLTNNAPTNVDSDMFYRSINATGQVQRLLARPAPLGPTADVRALVAGYVRGYDRYLTDTGTARLPDPSCRGAAWLRPITELDVWRRAYQFVTGALGGTGQFMPAILTAAPPPTTPPRSVSPPMDNALAAQVIGSNGLALGRAATRDGSGMVLANPHGPWTGQDRFYQLQLTIPGQLDVTGATFYGLPLIMPFGHTARLAFTATAATDHQYTVERLTLAPGDPTSYLVDGHRHAMLRQRITVPGGPARTLYRTPDGPVIQLPGTYDWTTTTAYVLHDAQTDNLRALNELLAMGRAETIGQLHTAMDDYQGLPSLNVFAADASGTADYRDVSVVPHITDAQAAGCLTTPADRARFAATGVAVLDGSRSACRPGSDPDAVEPGIFGPAQLPHLTRADYAANSNGSPWLVNPAQPLSYPRIVGDTGTVQRPRDRLGVDMVTQRIAGTDGFGAPGFSLDTLTTTALGDRNFFGEQWRDGPVQLCRAHPVLTDTAGQGVDVSAACDVLAHWDLHADLNSRGEVLFREFFNNLTGGGTVLPSDSMWAVPFDPAHPMTTPSGLNTANPAVGRALADAVHTMTTLAVPLDVPMGAVQRVTTPTGPVPVPGCQEQCYNIVSPLTPELTSAGAYPDVLFGTGFLMAVQLTPTGPYARTLLTYGESDNPASPHHWDQASLFSAKQWITERFTTAEITADPSLVTTVLGER